MRLDGLRQPNLDATEVGVLVGVANYFGFDHNPATVFGATGYAFMVNIHKDLCPSGPLAWREQWQRRHRGAERFNTLVPNLGIKTEYLGFHGRDASRESRRAVDAKLRCALDAGWPCALYNEEFQLVAGYDEDGFDAIGPYPDHLQRRLSFGTWQEWGDSVYADFYIYRKGAAADPIDRVRDSLAFALDVFRQPDDFATGDYSAGGAAYDRWQAAIGEFGATFGNSWNAKVWAECRHHASMYMTKIASGFPQVAALASELAQSYAKISANLRRVADEALPAAEKSATIAQTKDMELANQPRLSEMLARLAMTHASPSKNRVSPQQASDRCTSA